MRPQHSLLEPGPLGIALLAVRDVVRRPGAVLLLALALLVAQLALRLVLTRAGPDLLLSLLGCYPAPTSAWLMLAAALLVGLFVLGAGLIGALAAIGKRSALAGLSAGVAALPVMLFAALACSGTLLAGAAAAVAAARHGGPLPLRALATALGVAPALLVLGTTASCSLHACATLASGPGRRTDAMGSALIEIVRRPLSALGLLGALLLVGLPPLLAALLALLPSWLVSAPAALGWQLIHCLMLSCWLLLLARGLQLGLPEARG